MKTILLAILLSSAPKAGNPCQHSACSDPKSAPVQALACINGRYVAIQTCKAQEICLYTDAGQANAPITLRGRAVCGVRGK